MKLNQEIRRIVAIALQEDQTGQDVTGRFLLDRKQIVQAKIIAKEKGVLCGTEIAKYIFRKLDPECEVRFHTRDGNKVGPLKKIMTVKGKAFKILSAERTALNFLQHLSGIATLTEKFVDTIKGTEAKIYDTRKTIPGLRILQKYAVRCGGGQNHRLNLSAMVMVKDNHLKTIKGSELRVLSLKTKLPRNILLEIEAQNIGEVDLALRAKADIILLDNMSIPQMKKAILHIRNTKYKTRNTKPLIEVSGGVTLKNVRQIARLGVDRISVGAITHSVPAIDISMEIIRK